MRGLFLPKVAPWRAGFADVDRSDEARHRARSIWVQSVVRLNDMQVKLPMRKRDVSSHDRPFQK